MTTQKEAFQQALALIQSGEKEKARELLGRLLKADSKNVDYWLWMSTVVKTPKERVYCLREILAIDPKNEDAALGLRMLGEKAPPPDPSKQLPLEHIHWKTSLEIADEHPATSKMIRSRVLLYAMLGVAVVVIFGFGVYMALRPSRTDGMANVKRWTLTPLPSATETTFKATSTGYVAISIPQDFTATATPLYVATPHNRMEAYGAAMRAYEKGNWTSAIDFFNQVLDSEPDSPDIYYHIGDAYRALGQYSQANSAYQSALKLDANFAPAYLGKGRVLLENTPSKPKEAIDAFQQAIAKDPKMYEAYLEIARAELALNDVSAALTWLEKYTQYSDETAITALYKAQAYLMEGNSAQALEKIEASIQMDPTNVAAYKTWAEVLQTLGQHEESIPPLLAVIENTPLDLDSQALLARAYYEIGNTGEAQSLIDTLLTQDDENIEAYLLRGDIYLEQGMYDEANSAYNAVLRLDYNSFDANVGLGRVFLAKTLAGAAYNKFDYTEKLVTTDAQKATLMYWKAKTLLGLGEDGSAVKKFKEALEYAGGVLPQELKEDALARLDDLYTPTPTFTPSLTPKTSNTAVGASATPTP